MKLLCLLLAVLLCCGPATALTSLIRAGTDVARGALQTGTSLTNTGLGSARAFESAVPMLSSVLDAAETGTSMASNMGNAGLSAVDGATSMAILANSIMTNPWFLWIINLVTRLMAYSSFGMG